MPRRARTLTLPVSERPAPPGPAWLLEESYLLEAGAQSAKTEVTYRSALRHFADWLQHLRKATYAPNSPWPLSPEHLDTAVLLEYRTWLTAKHSRSTVTTYMAAVIGYLHFIDGMDMLSQDVQLGKLKRQIGRRRVERNQAETVIDLDIPRQSIPRIVEYYDELPLPEPTADHYNRRLCLLRDRALVHTLYSTAARISEVIALNRRSVDDGRARHAVVVGKGNKARTLHFREYAQAALRAYLAERHDTNPALFVAHSRNAAAKRLSVTSAHNTIKRAVKALELHESLSAHDFRHFRATQLLREGMPLEVVQEFLGHADISTTRSIYAPVLGVQVVGEWLDNLDVPPQQAGRPPETG